MSQQNSVRPSDQPSDEAWIGQLADQLLTQFPTEAIYTCAAGISPSGMVHFGNFRDLATSSAVAQELKLRGREARILFSWDDYDRFRKVPKGIDPSFSQYLGRPLTAVPDPFGELESYARHFEVEFEGAMEKLGIPVEYRYQTKEYTSGRYRKQIVVALERREEITDILLSAMSDKSKQEKGIDDAEQRSKNFPLTVYSRFSGTDNCKIISYDGGTLITYRDLVTGDQEQIDFAEHPIVKLPWKIDWPMRWGQERVHFEAGGKDHSAPNGSYDVARIIARQIFDLEPPIYQGYEFVGIRGVCGKMSGSQGTGVSPATLLEFYEPSLLKWLYMRRAPMQAFSLAFDTEVYRQYDEFDRCVASAKKGDASPLTKKLLTLSGVDLSRTQDLPPIPFKQAVALGSITQFQKSKLTELLARQETLFDESSIERRLPLAREWLDRHNPDQRIELLGNVNEAYVSQMDASDLMNIGRLRDVVRASFNSMNELETTLYEIPKRPSQSEKETKVAQRKFFTNVYMLLIGKDTGPRLATFLWAVDSETVVRLLNISPRKCSIADDRASCARSMPD